MGTERDLTPKELAESTNVTAIKIQSYVETIAEYQKRIMAKLDNVDYNEVSAEFENKRAELETELRKAWYGED